MRRPNLTAKLHTPSKNRKITIGLPKKRTDKKKSPKPIYRGVSGGAGHGELPRKFLPHPGDAWRREAPGETPGNATETRPPTLDEDDAAR